MDIVNKYYHHLLWLVCAVVVFIPLLTKNHIVQTIMYEPEKVSDFRQYVVMVDLMASGDTPWTLYPAQLYFGKFLAFIVNTFNVDTANLVMWFYFVLLFATIVAIYFVISKTTDKHNAWLGLGLSIFCTTGILGLYAYGVIFSVVNVYIWLLLAIYLAAKWLSGGRWYYFVLCIAFSLLYTVSHLTAFYAPYAMLVILGIMVLVKCIKRKSFSIRKPIMLWSIIFASNIWLTYKIFPIYMVFMNKVVNNNIASVVSDNTSTSVVVEGIPREYSVIYDPIAFSNFVMNFLSIATTVILTLVIFSVWKFRKEIVYSTQTKYMVAILGGFIIALGIGAFTVLAPDPVRAGIDMATLLAITIAIVLGSIKIYWLKYATIMLVWMYSIVTITSWVA